jgi:hypothetical protein
LLIFLILINLNITKKNQFLPHKMKMTLIIATLIQLSIYITLTYNNLINYYILIGLLINTVLLIRIFIGFGFKYTLTRLVRG